MAAAVYLFIKSATIVRLLGSGVAVKEKLAKNNTCAYGHYTNPPSEKSFFQDSSGDEKLSFPYLHQTSVPAMQSVLSRTVP